MFSRRAIGLFAALLTVLGCTTSRPIPSDGPIELKPNQGILVVHLDSSLPIERLKFNQNTAAASLPAGSHLFLVVVDAGNYRWTSVHVPVKDSNQRFRFSLRGRGYDWKFKVEPGQITYPGQLIFWGQRSKYYATLNAISSNRAAITLEKLQAQRWYPSARFKMTPMSPAAQ